MSIGSTKDHKLVLNNYALLMKIAERPRMYKHKLTVADLSLFNEAGERIIDSFNATYQLGINLIGSEINPAQANLYLYCLNGLINKLHPDYHMLGEVLLDNQNIYNNAQINHNFLLKCPILFRRPFLIKGTIYDNLTIGIKNQGPVFNNLELFRMLQNFLTRHQLWLKYSNILQRDIYSLDYASQQCVCLIRALLIEPYVVLSENNLQQISHPDLQLLLANTAEQQIYIFNSDLKH